MKPAPLPFGPVRGVSGVTRHALERFRERTGTTDDGAVLLRRLETWVKEARPVELKPGKVRLFKLLNHHCKPASYLLYGSEKRGRGWILVIENQTLVTVHRNQSTEWELKQTHDTKR